MGFPRGSDGKETVCNVGDLGFDPWVGKIPWRRAWQPTPVCLSGESPWTEEPGRLQSVVLKESDVTEATQRACTQTRAESAAVAGI